MYSVFLSKLIDDDHWSITYSDILVLFINLLTLNLLLIMFNYIYLL
jgi:hypothetical protein